MCVKQLLAGISIMLVLLVLFIPFGLVYGLIIHFTGQSYESIAALLLFLLLFCYIDTGAGTLIDSFLHAARERFEGLSIPKLVGSLIEFCGTFIVLSALDYFLDGIELTAFIKVIIALIHWIAGLFLERLEAEEEDEEVNLDPEMVNDIHICLQNMGWTDCVAIIHEKYPQVPKSEIIKAVRVIHIKGSSK